MNCEVCNKSHNIITCSSCNNNSCIYQTTYILAPNKSYSWPSVFNCSKYHERTATIGLCRICKEAQFAEIRAGSTLGYHSPAKPICKKCYAAKFTPITSASLKKVKEV
jgi:hypothetical protein